MKMADYIRNSLKNGIQDWVVKARGKGLEPFNADLITLDNWYGFYPVTEDRNWVGDRAGGIFYAYEMDFPEGFTVSGNISGDMRGRGYEGDFLVLSQVGYRRVITAEAYIERFNRLWGEFISSHKEGWGKKHGM